MAGVAALLPIIRGEMSKLKIPHVSDKVYKDECMFSFDSPFSDEGLYVNMITLRGYGKAYVGHDIKATGCKLYLHELWQQVPKEKATGGEAKEAQPTKLAIGVAGGFMTEEEYDIVKDHYLIVVNGTTLESVHLPCQELPEFVSNVAQAIIAHEGMKVNMQVASWDADNEKFVSRYAKDLEQINPTGKRIPQDPKLWRDEATGATENLWLNLSTGYIGGGRKNWDGSGGSGSALAHYEATGRKYPLAVKLGTITAHGADVWSYAPEEDAMVIDPHLAEHLSFWGIDIMKLEKTEKTVGEMEVAMNMSYDWTKIVEEGEVLEPVTGPGLLGFRNLGASCYLNSVMQSVLALPEVSNLLICLSHCGSS
jgi:ubiquitin carboxyl-terminal hydrolase 5/13